MAALHGIHVFLFLFFDGVPWFQNFIFDLILFKVSGASPGPVLSGQQFLIGYLQGIYLCPWSQKPNWGKL
jgi:hypothetical protein